MATPSVPQKSVSRRHFLSAVATIPAAAALAPVLSKVEAAAPNVEAWHIHPEIQRLVLDARGDVVAWADAPELARAIAEGGGYTLAKPAGAPAPTMVEWDAASLQAMAAAWSFDESTWPLDQVDAIERREAVLEPYCESSIFDTEAQRRKAVLVTAVEWANARRMAYLDASVDALQGLLPKDSIEARLLGRIQDAAIEAVVATITNASSAARLLGDRVPGDNLTAEARVLLAAMREEPDPIVA